MENISLIVLFALGLLHGILILVESHDNFSNSKMIIIGIGAIFAIYCSIFEFNPIIGNHYASYVPAEPTSTEPVPIESIYPPPPAYIILPEKSPTPTEPNSIEPVPTEPAPTEPTSTEPVPTEPASTEPTPTEPVPTEINLIENINKKVSRIENTLEKNSEAKEISGLIGKIKEVLERSITYISGLFTPYLSKRISKRMKKMRKMKKNKKKNKKN